MKEPFCFRLITCAAYSVFLSYPLPSLLCSVKCSRTLPSMEASYGLPSAGVQVSPAVLGNSMWVEMGDSEKSGCLSPCPILEELQLAHSLPSLALGLVVIPLSRDSFSLELFPPPAQRRNGFPLSLVPVSPSLVSPQLCSPVCALSLSQTFWG